jgi:hypothetical protein
MTLADGVSSMHSETSIVVVGIELEQQRIRFCYTSRSE